jgi:hypothetical protein
VVVGGVAGTVLFSAVQMTGSTDASPGSVQSSSPEPTSIATSMPVYPELPATEAPLTADGLALCRMSMEVFPMGQLAVDSNMQNLPQVAYTDLAAYILTDYSDQIAATGGGFGRTGLQILPTADGLDIQSVFDSAAAKLIPQLRDLVSLDGITVSAPVGYSFNDLCSAYLAARNLADAAPPGSGLTIPWYSLSLDNFGAVVLIDVPHDVPPAIREMQARYGPLIRVTVMPEGYQTGELY